MENCKKKKKKKVVAVVVSGCHDNTSNFDVLTPGKKV